MRYICALSLVVVALLCSGTSPAPESVSEARLWLPEGFGPLYGIDALAPDDVWVVGSIPAYKLPDDAFIGHWDGKDWSISAKLRISESRQSLSSVAAITKDDVWAVGEYEEKETNAKMLITHWDGVEWKVVPGPQMAPGSHTLRSIAALSQNDIWAVGSSWAGDIHSRSPLILHWNGKEWSISPGVEMVEGNLYGVAALTERDVWAVGSSGNETLALHWDGLSWSRVPTPNSSSDVGFQFYTGKLWHTLSDITAVRSNDVWAVGYVTDNWPGSMLPYETPILMHWDGTTWSLSTAIERKEYGLSRLPLGVVAGAAEDVRVVGGRHYPLFLQWDGKVWTTHSCPAANVPVNKRLGSLYGIAKVGDEVWAVGETESRSGYILSPRQGPCPTPTPHPTPIPYIQPTCGVPPDAVRTAIPQPVQTGVAPDAVETIISSVRIADDVPVPSQTKPALLPSPTLPIP